jgi:glycosyltransferase involved in cell wall biosynthesis
LVDAVQARRWQRLQHDIAAEVDRVVVCSSLDQRYLDVPNAAIVPNGYPVPVVAAGTPEAEGAAAPPSMLFVGPLTYEPNRLAVQWIAERVLPIVRRTVPDFVFDVVGNDPGFAIAGTEAPGVHRRGYVEDVGPYYAQATVAVTPLHSGGGTRLKVIEALARRVPLVSTSFAFEGLGLVADRDLLVADDPATFAAACVAVSTQAGLRSRLTDAGYRCFRHHLTAEASSHAVQCLANDVIVGATEVGAPAGRRQA